jgi:hypothetical protein
MTSLHQQSGRRQFFGQLRFDPRRRGALDVLQMQGGPGEHFEAALQYAACRTDAGLVLIETLRWTVLAHTHIYAVGRVPVAEIKKHQVDVRSPRGGGTEPKRDFVEYGQPVDITHRQPFRNRSRGAGPQAFERAFNRNGHFATHPQLVNAVRPHRTVGAIERAFEVRRDLVPAQTLQGAAARRSFGDRHVQRLPAHPAHHQPYRSLCGHFLVRKMRSARPLRSMLDCNGTNIALRVNVKNGAVIEIAGLGNRSVPKLNEQSIGVGKVANFHGTNLRSKKALWTVCPSANRITRR